MRRRNTLLERQRSVNKLVMVVTEQCNLSCSYCYVVKSLKGKKPGIMSEATAREIVRKFLYGRDQCSLIQFFGGEPTLNLSTVKAAVMEARQLVEEGVLRALPRFAIVTNGTCIASGEMAKIASDLQIETTVSVDGPATIHDALRATCLGAPTHAKAIETISALSDAKLPLAVESVYTSRHIDMGFSIADILEFFRDMGVRKLIFRTACPPAPNELNPLIGSHLDTTLSFYREAVDWWFESLLIEDHPVISVYFDELLLPLIEGTPAVAAAGCPASTQDFAVGPEGDLYACQLFYGNADYQIGNVLAEEYYEPSVTFPNKSSEIQACSECFARYWCQPCPALNAAWGNLWQPPTPECTMRRLVVFRIAQWACEYLSVPDNQITSILKDKVLSRRY